MMQADKIIINNLKIFAHHGVFEFEKQNGQYFLISCILETDTRQAGISDELEKTVSYAEICEEIKKITTEKNYDLLEALAEQICQRILIGYGSVISVEVEILKISAPINIEHESVGIRIKRQRHTVYLSCGSNLGDRQKYLDEAILALNSAPHTKVKRVSKIVETKPYGYTEQPYFLNLCAEVETLLYPQELLRFTSEIEKNANRTRDIHWGPRTLDIDIIFYDNEIINDENLIIPHIEMEKRAFVLSPLCEIAPRMIHPIFKKTVKELLEQVEHADNYSRS